MLEDERTISSMLSTMFWLPFSRSLGTVSHPFEPSIPTTCASLHTTTTSHGASEESSPCQNSRTEMICQVLYHHGINNLILMPRQLTTSKQNTVFSVLSNRSVSFTTKRNSRGLTHFTSLMKLLHISLSLFASSSLLWYC